MKIPAALTAGDSASWLDLAFGNALGQSVSSAAYALTYSFRGPVANAGFDLAGVASGTGWQFTLSTSQSAALNAGSSTLKWYWTAAATKSGERITAGQGILIVRPNLAALATSGTYDGRSQAEVALAAIEAEIQARATGGATIEYTIGNRSLKKEPITALLALRSQYRLIVSRERRAQAIGNGLGNPQRVGVRFS